MSGDHGLVFDGLGSHHITRHTLQRLQTHTRGQWQVLTQNPNHGEEEERRRFCTRASRASTASARTQRRVRAGARVGARVVGIERASA